MGGDDDHHEVDIRLGINKIIDFIRIRFKSRGKTLKVVELFGDNDSRVYVIQTDKGTFIFAIRKEETKLKIVMIDAETGKILGTTEV
jgi:uncharacterized membrane protein YkoI